MYSMFFRPATGDLRRLYYSKCLSGSTVFRKGREVVQVDKLSGDAVLGSKFLVGVDAEVGGGGAVGIEQGKVERPFSEPAVE